MTLLSFDELAEKVGTRKVLAIKAWCARNRVKWLPDYKGRPITTLAALDRSLARGKDSNTEPRYEI